MFIFSYGFGGRVDGGRHPLVHAATLIFLGERG